MDQKNIYLKNNFDIILVLVIYLIIGLVLVNNYQYIINSDGISYISIAQKYLNGNFAEAINGYWGPLFSWLLAPFLLFGSTPLYISYSAKILSLIIGFFTIIGFRLLINRFKMKKIVKIPILFALIPIVLYFAFNLITPDLLITCILIYYFYFIFDPKYDLRLLNGLLCGFIGSLAYLSKSYALPFILAHFVLFNLIYYYKSISPEKKKRILKNLFVGLTVFFIISGLWIGLISSKYNEITIGTTGTYNHNLVGPESLGTSPNYQNLIKSYFSGGEDPFQSLHPMAYQGLIKPPYNTSLSIWEDPSHLKMKSWNPFESWNYFEYQIKLILGNIILIFYSIEYFSLISILIILISILFLIKSSDSVSKDKIMYLLITIVLYAGGYSLILVQIRYLWLIYILIILMSGYLLTLFYNRFELKKPMKIILVLLLVGLFLITPLNGLIVLYNAEKNVYHLSETFKNDYGMHGNIASNDKWELTIYFVYYVGGKYYGQTMNYKDYISLKKELNDNNIDYYMVWGNSNENEYFSPNFKEITNGTIESLRIYSLKDQI